ncbi:TetR/AcrR family transcriptional regulator [Vibrio sonorensis]|uniref:TetR/AcrR family transcriptional regulator n=1 Tax=Vibrio sonorensis TaxID=1004316 RepID=UPI0008D8FFE3|nr:TetR/AcrR family transcriptional regulator [Vibrio sonorensis]
MNKRQLTRQKILDTAWQLFAEQGYEVTTTRQIARAARVADGTVFSHFPSKLDMLREGVSHQVNDLAKKIDVSEQGGLLDIGMAFADVYYRYYFDNVDLSRALLKEVLWDMDYYQKFNHALFSNLRDSEQIKEIVPLILDAYFMTLVFHLSKPQPSAEEALKALESKYRVLLQG